METILTYELKTAVVLAVFYLFYNVFLTRETFHRLNRIVLLGTAVAAFILPLCVITITKEVALPLSYTEVPATLQSAASTTAERKTVWLTVAAVIYLAGAAAVFALQTLSYLRAWHMIKRCSRMTTESGAELCIADRECAPFSLFGRIVIGKNDAAERSREIVIHEQAHVEAGHSWDILLVNICLCMQWFNPAAWMLKRDLQTIHEYEADDAVLRSGVDAESYQLLLIKKAVGKRLYSVANSLNHSNLKKRITMMLSKKSSSRRMWKLAYVLPLMCGAMAAFAEERTVFIEPTPAQQDKVTETIAKSETIGQENLAEDKKTTVISIQNDTTTKADTIEYYINGRIATDEEVENLDSATIIHMNINKNNKTKRIDITTKGAEEKVVMINIDKKERPVVIMEGGVRTTHRDIYIDGKKVSQEEMNELSAERIINVDVKDDRIDITTKKEGEGIPETKGKIIRIATADELYDISELLKNKEQFIYYEIPENVAEKMNEMTAQLKTTTMPDTDTQRIMEDIQAAMAGLDAMSADMAAFSADFEAIKSQTLADWAKMAENGEIDKSQVDDVRTNIATNEKQFKKMKREFEREAKKAKKRLEKYQAELDE